MQFPQLVKSVIDRLREGDPEAGQAQEAKRLLDAYCVEIGKNGWDAKPGDYASGRAILEADPRVQIHVLFASYQIGGWGAWWRLSPLLNLLFARSLPWTAADLERLLAYQDKLYSFQWGNALRPVQRFVEQGNRLTPGMEAALRFMQKLLKHEMGSADARKVSVRISTLLGEDRAALPDAGEAWAELARADVAALPEEKQAAWKRLF
ncbi:MAG TPA: hypothetical protein VKU00_19725, partial [Chthonomonadaceae bacterium]|nr:hypothetical protein [Chthonomonadaceae bacterium]